MASGNFFDQFDAPAQAPQTFIPPNPILAQRAAEEEERKRRDQQLQEEANARAAQAAALQAQQVQATLASQPLIDEGRALENEAKRRKLEPAETASPADNLRRVIDQIDRVGFDAADNNGWFETGFSGSLLRNVKGTPAYDLAANIKTIDANLAFEALAEMRRNSPTGGALGQVTERELELLRSTVANLDPNLSQPEFFANLAQAKKTYLDMLRKIDPAAADEYANKRGIRWDESGQPFLFSKDGTDDRDPIDPLGVYSGQQPPSSGPSGGPGGSFMGQMSQATQNALAGAAQGALGVIDFPMEIGRAVERGTNFVVGRGGEFIADTLGLPGVGDWWRQGAEGVDARLANRPSGADLIEQLSPTPEGMEAARFTSQLLGGAALPLRVGARPAPRPTAPTAPAALSRPAAQDIIDQGAQNNVRVMTSDVRPPSTFIGRNLRTIGERIPYAGTGGPRAAQQAERVEAVKSLARDFGADVGIEYLEEIADDFARTRGARIQGLTQQKRAIIDNVPGAVPVNRALAEIDAQIAELSRLGADEVRPVIERLTGWRQALQGKSLVDIEEMRKIMGSAFDDPGLAGIRDRGQKAVNAIYAPLRDDMGDFIRQQAGEEAFTRWQNANKQLSNMAGQLDDRVFRGVLNSAETTPENVARLLFSKKPSEISRLMSNLSPAGRAKAQAAVISRALERSGDDISPDRFANEIARLGKSIGVAFDPTDQARIYGLTRLINATKQASVASVSPPTGAQNMPIVGGYAAGAVFGPGAAPVLGAFGGAARIYESAAVRNLLVGLGRSKPGSKQERKLMERVFKVLSSQSQIQPLGRAANENLPIITRSAAEDRDSQYGR